ncbi:hypothetical protein HHK36_023799 [Tetracentron sinense]|uniref:Cysteine-rich PDZ-binding protein n=1 Tax=Tetracentron sinense TaxID=13715 RepID=A0A834YM01_TETSI|nr:hypothetical protein HHK36_023799 [Tetracentron sinense]
MVCEKCQKKLTKVIVPDKWKEGASNTTEGGGRKINENKLLSKKNRWTPYGTTKCIICKQQVHQDGKYCHTCAYTKGNAVEYVRCAVSKYLTPRITSRATYNGKCYALACEDGVLLFVALGSVNWCNQISSNRMWSVSIIKVRAPQICSGGYKKNRNYHVLYFSYLGGWFILDT